MFAAALAGELEAPMESPVAVADDAAFRRMDLTRGQEDGEVTLGKYWILDFKIIPTGTVYSWNNILHLTATDSNSGWGARIPGVWFHSNSRRLHVCVSCNGNSNFCVNPSSELALNQESMVSVQIWGGSLYVAINGRNEVSERCDSPYEPLHGTTGKLYTSGPWHPAASATLVSCTYTPLDFDTVKGKLINDRLYTSPEFELSFDIRPQDYFPTWNNIIHVTETDQNTGDGARIPGIWFRPYSLKLHACVYCSREMVCVDAAEEIPLLQTSRVVLTVKPGDGAHRLELFVQNGQWSTTYTKECLNPYSSTHPAKMYQSGPWHPAAAAYIENLEYKSISADSNGRRMEEVQELAAPFPEA